MSNSIVITEKPSQAKNVTIAVGKSYGDVYAAFGHLIDLEEPEKANPLWDRWNCDLLMPPSGRYRMTPVLKTRQALSAIGSALKVANTVYIATDCDREGQLIGQEILEFYKFKGDVKRVIFNAEDPTTLKAAFAAAQPNANFQRLYEAGEARRQSDQIYNLTLTRVATVCLKEPYTKGAIGIGRVKTPTMGIVCQREKEIANFKPQDYHEIVAEALGSHPFTTRYAPQVKIQDKSRADAIRAAAAAHTGPVSVKTDRKAKGPPKLFDLPSLQTKCSSWGWTAKKTLDVAQSLYETHTATTYPRAEARYLPEQMTADVPRLRGILDAACKGLFDVVLATPAVIRVGKDGTFSDKQLQGVSHHAIIPNINCPNMAQAVGRMSPDERKLFTLIARTYAANMLPDFIYDATVITMPVKDPAAAATLPFVARGSVPVSPGWKTAMGTDADDEDEDGALPPIADGEVVKVTKATVESKVTKPPPRYSEGALITAMKEAWRFVEDPDERDRLKEAKGIGTPATRDTVIETLKRQELFLVSGKTLIPSQAAMELYDLIQAVAPAMSDAGATARMEMLLDEVEKGTIKDDDAIKRIASIASSMIPAIVTAGGTMKLTSGKVRPPSAPPARAISKSPSAKAPSGKPAAASRAATVRSASRPAPAAAARTQSAVQGKTTAYRQDFVVAFDDREKAKAHGLRWDPAARLWYSDNPANTAKAEADFKKK